MEIGLERLCKRFGDVRAVEDVNLRIGDGELLGLLGPSGCGKTTTLLTISGLHRPSAGRILFGERDVTDLAPQERNVGVVFQSYALYPHLSVHDNIAFPLRVQRRRRDEIDRRIRRITGILRIDDLLQRRPGELSGGQQQRVALARALVREPDAMLMDEPLANLDAALRMEMRGEIRRIHKETGCTTVLVTHDQVEAMSMCDRIAVMNDGRIEQVDTPDALYRAPRTRFVAAFIGNPPIAFCRGEARDGEFVGEGIRLPLPESIERARLAPGTEIVAGIRPEHLQPGLAVAVEGTIAAVESRGREAVYDLALTGGSSLRSVQAGPIRHLPGERVRWGLDAAAVLFFDEAGTRIG